MSEAFSRTELLLGPEGMERLKKAHVAVFGIGGVGSFAAEALARSGVGYITLFDNDKVCVSNINRQLVATTKTVGEYKTRVMRDRILEINPDAVVEIQECFYLPENADQFDLSKFDYIIDAIDTVSAKLELAVRADKADVPIISSMGAGNKLDPTRFEVADINKTSVCPLARVMRRELKQRGIKKLKVVYSKEPALIPMESRDERNKGAGACLEKDDTGNAFVRRQIPGSIAFVPSVAGLILAGEVIRDIVNR